MAKNGGGFSYDVVNTNEYLDKVVNEVLRKYPPGVRLERLCTKDYRIENTNSIIPKGSILWFPLYTTHFEEKHFPDPHKFDPERFSPEAKAKRHPYAYMPFGHGPRNCIASRFAWIMVKAAIASLVLNFHLQSTEETNIPIKFRDNIGLVRPESFHLKLIPIINN